MRSFARSLEDFGNPERGRESDAERRRKAELAAARGEGHAAGYAEGFAAALAQAETEDRAVLLQVLEAARDMTLHQESALAEAVAGLRPVIESILRLVAPVAAERGLGEAVAEVVTARLRTGADPSLVLCAAPERVEALRERFHDDLPVTADAALGPRSVRLDWANGGAVFDADACIQAAMAGLEAFYADFGEEGLRHAG
jgi:flagellar biosynthesis/type III secretory pathway protein FliH